MKLSYAIITGHTVRRFGRGAMVLLALICFSTVFSQHAPAEPSGRPARNADVYNGRNHQPTQSEVETRERALGLAPNSRMQSEDNQALELLYEKLERNEHID